jgi:hypothetical protein
MSFCREPSYFIGVLQNDKTPTEALENILEDSRLSHSVLTALAKHPALPYDFFKKYNFTYYAPLSFNLPVDQAQQFLKDDNVDRRKMLASNRRVSADILYELSMDPESSVRYRVATNTNSSHDALSFLSVDPETDVRIGVAKNRSAWADILSELSKDSNPIVRQGVAENPNCPKEVMEFLCSDPDEDVRRKTALNPTASYSIVKKLSNDESSKVRVAALRSPLISKDDLIECLDDRIMALSVRKLFLPEDVLLRLEESTNKKICEAVAENSNHPGFIQVLKDRPKESKWFKKKFRLSTPEEKKAIDADNYLYLGIEDVEKLLDERNDITKLLSLESDRNENIHKINHSVENSDWTIRLAAIRTGLLNKKSLLKLSTDENADVELYASTVLANLRSEEEIGSLQNEVDGTLVSCQSFENLDLVEAIVKKIRGQNEASVSILDPVWGRCCRFDHLFFDEGVAFLKQIWNMGDWESFWRKVKKSGVQNACLVASSAVPSGLLRIIFEDLDKTIAYCHDDNLKVLQFSEENEENEETAIIYVLAANPGTPPDVLSELIHNAPDLRRVVARNPGITSEIAAELKKSCDREIFMDLAANEGLPGYFSDEYPNGIGSAEEISRNPMTPPDVLHLLARHESWWVRKNVASHKNTRKETLDILVNDDGRGCDISFYSKAEAIYEVISEVATHKNTSYESFRKIMESNSKKLEDVKYCLASNSNVPRELYEKLDKKNYLYDEFLSMNKGLSHQEYADLYERCISKRTVVSLGPLGYLAENPAVPIEILSLLISDPYVHIRESAQKNKKWQAHVVDFFKTIESGESAYADMLLGSLEEPVPPDNVSIPDLYRAIRVLMIIEDESDYSRIPRKKIRESLDSSDILVKVSAIFNDKTTVSDLKKMLKNGAGQLTPLVQWRIGELTKVENT